MNSNVDIAYRQNTLDEQSKQKSVVEDDELKELLRKALTEKIDDREMFMKRIDRSYYYEQPDGEF
jgi:cell filamentation protein